MAYDFEFPNNNLPRLFFAGEHLTLFLEQILQDYMLRSGAQNDLQCCRCLNLMFGEIKSKIPYLDHYYRIFFITLTINMF